MLPSLAPHCFGMLHEQLSLGTEPSSINFTRKIVLKRPSISNIVEDLVLHIHCSSLLQTEVWDDMKDGLEKAVLQSLLGSLCFHYLGLSRERVSNLIWKMVLKRPFFSDTMENLALHIHCSGLLGDRGLSWYERWSWKGCSCRTLGRLGSAYSLFRSPRRQSFMLVTLEKPLHIYCSALLGDIAHPVDIIVLFERWSWIGFSLARKALLCTFIVQVSQETELFRSCKGWFCIVSNLGRNGGLERMDFGQFSAWEGLVVLKGLVFNSFYFDRMWWSWNNWPFIIYTLVRCGGPESSCFQ